MTEYDLSVLSAIRSKLSPDDQRLADAMHSIVRGLSAECDRLKHVEESYNALYSRQVDYINNYADARRVVAWADNPNRLPAVTAFTEGPERQIAYRFEMVWSAKRVDITSDTRAVVIHADNFSGVDGRDIVEAISAAFAAPLRLPVLIVPTRYEFTPADDEGLNAIGLQRNIPN